MVGGCKIEFLNCIVNFVLKYQRKRNGKVK